MYTGINKFKNPTATVTSQALSIAVVVPIFNEGAQLVVLAESLLNSTDSSWDEVIFIDASTNQKSKNISRSLIKQYQQDQRFCLIQAAKVGRAQQMNQGANIAKSAVLLFLHADTKLPDNASALIANSLADGAGWGRFDVQLDAEGWAYRMIAFFMNWRSTLTGICTGDQALFIRRELFTQVGGFPLQALMEDIRMSQMLKKHSYPIRLREPVITSARRWQQKGVVRTIVLMWGMRLAYWLGVSPKKLAGWYRNVR